MWMIRSKLLQPSPGVSYGVPLAGTWIRCRGAGTQARHYSMQCRHPKCQLNCCPEHLLLLLLLWQVFFLSHFRSCLLKIERLQSFFKDSVKGDLLCALFPFVVSEVYTGARFVCSVDIFLASQGSGQNTQVFKQTYHQRGHVPSSWGNRLRAQGSLNHISS